MDHADFEMRLRKVGVALPVEIGVKELHPELVVAAGFEVTSGVKRTPHPGVISFLTSRYPLFRTNLLLSLAAVLLRSVERVAVLVGDEVGAADLEAAQPVGRGALQDFAASSTHFFVSSFWVVFFLSYSFWTDWASSCVRPSSR